ncbi:MAG: AsmA family protein [Alphaproteobacteria bacterium]|nr:AsmA family protein [Alphaproteobacteria bacterium]
MKEKKKYGLFPLIIRAFGLAFTGLVVSLVIALTKVNLETLRNDIAAGLSVATGVPVEITGKVSWKLSLRPRATLQDVRIANADWAQNPDAVRIDAIVVTLNLFSVFSDRPIMQDLRLINMQVNIEQNDKGEWSIIRESGDGSWESPDNKFPFDFDIGLEILELINPQVTVITPDSHEKWSLSAVRVKYKKSSERIEYSGFIEKDGEDYSFIAAFSGLDEARKVYPVRIAIASRISPLVINAALEATSKIPIDFIITGTVANLHSMGKLLNLDLPETPKFNVNISGGFGHQKLTLHKSSIKFGQTDLSLSGEFDWKASIPVAALKLKSQNFMMTEVFPELYASGSKWVRPNRDLNVFKDVPLYSEMLRACDCKINLDIGNIIVYRELAFQNILADVNIQNGMLDVDFKGKAMGGDVTAVAKAYDDRGVLRARASGRGRNIMTMGILHGIREYNFLSGLPASFDFYLESHGADLSGLMSNVTGPIKVYSVGSGYALSDSAEYFYGKDFLTAVRHNVTDIVTRDKRDTMRINCAATNIKLRNGNMETERGVAIETTEVNIRAQGFVDLGAERLQASIVTTPVRGLKISISGNVINSMEFSGNIAEPDLKINRSAIMNRAVAATSVGLILAPFTGGLSIAAGAGVGLLTSDLLTNWLADDHPCKTALERGAPAQKGDPEFLNRPVEILVDEMLGTVSY